MTNNAPQIFSVSKCAVEDCLSPWWGWCRADNLVYCGIHLKDHNCKKVATPKKLDVPKTGKVRGKKCRRKP